MKKENNEWLVVSYFCKRVPAVSYMRLWSIITKLIFESFRKTLLNCQHNFQSQVISTAKLNQGQDPKPVCKMFPPRPHV